MFIKAISTCKFVFHALAPLLILKISDTSLRSNAGSDNFGDFHESWC